MTTTPTGAHARHQGFLLLLFAASATVTATDTGEAACPAGAATLERGVHAEGLVWTVCEDLSTPGGGVWMVPVGGAAPVHFPKRCARVVPRQGEAGPGVGCGSGCCFVLLVAVSRAPTRARATCQL